MFSIDSAKQYRPPLKASIRMLIGLVASVALLGADSAFACECAPPDVNEELRRSDAAVVGRLVAVTPRGQAMADYRYRVRLVVKGPGALHRGQLLVVRSARDEAACGLPADLGRSYGLFVDRAAGLWSAGRCQVVSPEEMRDAESSAGTSTVGPSGCG
jgi:hypothetical protein